MTPYLELVKIQQCVTKNWCAASLGTIDVMIEENAKSGFEHLLWNHLYKTQILMLWNL